jgi:hypothetical protein
VFLPPLPLIAGSVVLLMMNGAQRYGEFITHLEPGAPRLCKADVMDMAWRSPANWDRIAAPQNASARGFDSFWLAWLLCLCARTVEWSLQG